MSVEQLIYTSCRTGIKNQGAGFQVYSHSVGIAEHKLLDIQRRFCQYKEPFHLPGSPTETDIETLFPVSLSFNRFSEDTMCISQTAYVGRDYMGESGRFGNYISHVLTIPTREIDFYPIELYGTQVFRRRLAAQEANSTNPPGNLQQLSGLRPELSAQVSVESVMAFMAEDGRVEMLKKMLCGVLRAKANKKKLLICDSYHNTVMWIAGILMSFPTASSKEITFNTYAFDFMDCDALVMGVSSEGTSYSPQNAAAMGMFYIFDMVNDVISDTGPDFQFSDLIEVGFEFSRESLEDFHQFLEMIDYTDVDDTFDDVYNLYKLQSEVDWSISEEELVRALAIAEQYANASVLSNVYKSFVQEEEMMLGNLSLTSATDVNKFLFACAERLKSKEISHFANRFFVASIQKLVFDLGESEAGGIAKFCNTIFDSCQSKQELFSYLLSGNFAAQVRIWLEENTVPFHNAFFAELISNVLVRTRDPIGKYIQTSESVFVTVVKNLDLMPEQQAIDCASRILESPYGSQVGPDLFIIICKGFENKTHLVNLLAEKYCRNLTRTGNAKQLENFHGNLAQQGMETIAVAIFPVLLKEHPRPREFFWEYCSWALKYNNRKLAEDLALIFVQGSQSSRGDISIYNDIIERLIGKAASEKFIVDFARRYNEVLPLDPDSSTWSSANTLYNLVGGYQITGLGKLKLICFMGRLLNAASSKSYTEVEPLCNVFGELELGDIPEKDLEAVLKRVLPKVAPVLATEAEHAAMHKVFQQAPYKIFIKQYTSAIFKEYKDRGSTQQVMSYFAYVIDMKKDVRSEVAISEYAIDRYEDFFFSLSEANLEKLTQKFAKCYPKSVFSHWNRVLNAVEERRKNTIAGVIKSVFRKR